MRVLVAGRVLAAAGQPGAAWTVLGWVLGLRSLGHEVTLVEPLPTQPTEAQRRWSDLVERAAAVRPLVLTPDDAVPPADLLVNLSGVLPVARAAHVPHRVYVDVDPGFTQAWASAGEDLGLGGHTAYVTVGLCVGTAGCRVPDLGLGWHRLPPPVPLDAFPVADGRGVYATTVGNWRSYGTARLDGAPLGQRAHTMRRILDLPGRAPLPLRPALAIDAGEHADLERLAAAGWRWSDPSAVAGTPEDYRSFVAGSRLEFGIAKAGYVSTGSGWFSDRTAAYLAAGRPAVVTDTGLGGALPVGEGLLTWSDTDDAVAALEAVLRHEDRHRRAARGFAETHLDARRVAADLLERTC